MQIRSALVLLCTLGVATLGALAQTSPPPTSGPPNAEQRLDRLAVLLDLTDAQKGQVKAVLDAQHVKMKAQFDADRASGTRPTFEQMKATREQLKAETLQQLSSVLTASQLKKFQVLMEDEHGPGRGPHGRWHGDAPPASSN
jgi:Spy/CpxP family protein refolding chaperone